MTEDVVRDLGILCLGSRFRRIGERLQADTQRILDELGVTLQPSQYPALAAIDRLGPLAIGELAEALGITQPGATRVAALLVEAGYLTAQRSDGDQRVRLMSLTRKGRELVDMSKRDVWPRVEAAVADLCGDMSAELLELLGRLEDGLDEKPLPQRAKIPEAVTR